MDGGQSIIRAAGLRLNTVIRRSRIAASDRLKGELAASVAG